MYLISVGAGDIGSRVLDVATRQNHEVVVIEKDRVRAEWAKSNYDVTVINADATSHDVFVEATPTEADAIISTTEEDATNLMVMMLANRFEIPTLVSVVHDPKHMDFFEEIGVTVMENPQQVIAKRLVNSIQNPAVEDFLQLEGDAEIFEVSVEENALINGESIRSAQKEGLIPADSFIIAIERNGKTISAQEDTTFKTDDIATIYSQSGTTSDIMRIFEDENEV
ncbi:potassium channel family protein [Haladaptatus halobius]|uniref:potassium channel family protein n=1 Tax=Haladaptatus halobius TaxID=2884875 RepID=UPI001D09A3B5|nr:TrkA family potassium uptake protein [Haladaptatus halobius]